MSADVIVLNVIDLDRQRLARGLPAVGATIRPGRKLRHAQSGKVVTVLRVHPHHIYAELPNGGHRMVRIEQLAPLTQETPR